MKIVVLDGYAANPGDLSWEELKSLGECSIYDRTSPEEVMARAQHAEVLLTNKTVLTHEHIEALPDLKYIGVLATGYNIVDVEAARKRGIVVTNIPAYSTDSVAQLVFAHILNIAQQVQHHAEEVRRGRWTQSPDFCFWDTPLMELRDKKIGIIGLGHTGYKTARIAIGFSMKVMAYTSKSLFQLPPEIQKADSMEQLFAECDIISLHCPLTESTRSLVNAERLALMKPSAILINTARGPVVDSAALADALNCGKIAGAGVDVFEMEPPVPADHPLLNAKNLIATPHVAFATREALVKRAAIVFDNIDRWIKGTPANVI